MKILQKILFIVLIHYSLSSFSQSINLGKEININNNDSFSGYEILDSHLVNHRLVLSGENHYYTKKNISIEMKLFRYLVKKKGFKHLIIELGYGLGQMMNIYVQTGDTLVLKKIENSVGNSYFRFTKNLRSFYVSLPDSQKFSVHCIDVERFFNSSVGYLNYLIPKDKPIPDNLKLNIEALKSLEAYLLPNQEESNEYDKSYVSTISHYNNYGLSEEKTLRFFIRNFDSLNMDYRNYLGEKYHEFSTVIDHFRDKFIHESLANSAQQTLYREQYIFNTFQKLANQFPNDKFYGQFGRCHATDTSIFNECHWYNVPSFINRVNTNSNFNAPCRAFSIAIAYTNFRWEENSYSKKATYTSEFSPYITAVKEEQTLLFPIYNDTANAFLKNRFKYIIVSKENISDIAVEGDSTESTTTKRDKRKNNYEDFMHYAFSYGITQMDVSRLNRSLNDASFNSSFETFGFQIFHNVKYNEVSGGASFNIIREQNSNYNGDTSFSIRGYNFGFQLGYDIIQRYEKIAIIPLVGFNFQQMKLISNISDTETGFPFSKTSAVPVYRNPTILVSPHLDIRFNPFGSLWIGCKSGYNLDFGNTHWRHDGKLRNTGANLKQSGLFFEGLISFGNNNW